MPQNRIIPPRWVARFSSALARVMFVEPAVDGAVRARACELRLARAVAKHIERADDRQLHAMAHHLDSQVLPCLSGEAMMEVACAIEHRAPWMFENMPGLAAHQRRLKRASDMAGVFSRDHLAKLSEALRREASRS